MVKKSLRAGLLVLAGALALYGATIIPASAYQLGEDAVTAALIIIASSRS